MTEAQILQEEKEYWIKQVGVYREASLGARRVADAFERDLKLAQDRNAELQARLRLISDVLHTSFRTGYPLDTLLGSISLDALSRKLEEAESYIKPQSSINIGRLVHVAWRGAQGGIHPDVRPLSKADADKVKKLNGSKHKLYAILPDDE